MDKIPGSRSGSGRVGVSKNRIGYFWVSFSHSGISGYFGYFWVCRVFTGIYGYYLRVFTGILDIISHLVEVSKLLKFDESPGDLEGIHANI